MRIVHPINLSWHANCVMLSISVHAFDNAAGRKKKFLREAARSVTMTCGASKTKAAHAREWIIIHFRMQTNDGGHEVPRD